MAGASRDDAALWTAVDRLIDRAPTWADLYEHGIHLLAARRYRAAGETVPPEAAEEERFAAVRTLLADELLRQVRAAYDGQILVIKGSEVALRYPKPALRPTVDVDILVSDAHEAQRALLANGFQEAGDPSLFTGIHHLRPLVSPSVPMSVEVHLHPKWIETLDPPSNEELLDVAVESRLGIDGIQTLPAAHHVLVLVAHSWAHEPFRRLVEVIDIAAMSSETDPGEVGALAERWKIRRAWETTQRAADAVLYGAGPLPFSTRVWARNLPAVRGRTVLESHLEHWLSPFAALPAHRAVRVSLAEVGREFRPGPDETWRDKARRSGLAIRNAFVRRSVHEGALEHRHDPRGRV